MLPNFLIVGGQRCGTSSVNHYLSQHPEVFVAPGKELRFFNRHFDRGLEWYESQFRPQGDVFCLGEATPSYMYDPLAVARIAEVLPSVRLVVILRDPIARAYSHYLMVAARGREGRSFEEAVEEELNGSQALPSYVNQGRYLHQLRRLSASLPLAPLHVMITEQLAAQPVESFQDLCRFLEVDPSFAPADLGRRVNRFTEFRSLALRRKAKQLRPGLIRRALEAANVRHTAYRPLNAQTRQTLRRTFEREVRDLSEYLGRDLSAWWW
jgi:hypothetical protein